MKTVGKPLAFAITAAAAVGSLVLYACQDTEELTEPSAAAAAVQYRLTLTGMGTGSGVVTSSPSGINCTITAGTAGSSGCTALYNSGVTVTLTAKPAGGHAFGGWVRHCVGSGTCVLKMNVSRSLAAEFRKGPFSIEITSANPSGGSGRVRSQTGLSPAIDCTITNGTPAATGCSATYPAYTVVTLSATPAAGSAFDGWRIAGCGTANCQLTATQNYTVPAAFSLAGTSVPATQGRWDPAFTTPVVAVHIHLMRNGKVLLWGDNGNPQLWTPGGGFSAVSKPYRIYCSGHTFLPDGRLLVMGGTSPGTLGLRDATVFNPSTSTWSPTNSMAQGRYYPTATTLPNGEILVVSGHDTAKKVVTIPEVRTSSGTWRRLTAAPLAIPDPFYPDMFVAPNGKVFMAGFQQTSRYLSVSGTGLWTTVANRIVADRRLGSAVMYAPGKVMYAGGGDPPTASAEVIDLNQGAPTWRSVPGMAFRRRQMNSTILADGSVLVTGGTSGAGFNDQAGAVYEAELWDPKTETWKTMAREAKVRAYHSAALLLPDGRVLSTGGGEGGGIDYVNSEFSGQLFSPPYLFNSNGTLATRPTISSVPAKLTYGLSFTVGTPNAASITRGNLVKLSSTTHAFNASQLLYPLTFTTASSTSVRAVAPANGNQAPPGPYMLFLLNAAGVPSVAKIVMVGP